MAYPTATYDTILRHPTDARFFERIQRSEDDGVRPLGMREPLKGGLGVPELKVPELPE